MNNETYRKGLEIMREHFGDSIEERIGKIADISPEFARLNVEFPFGCLYARDVLDQKTRELCTLAALTVKGSCLPQLASHVEGALNCGASREEIIEVVLQMLAYCGFPDATNALLTVNEVFERIDT